MFVLLTWLDTNVHNGCRYRAIIECVRLIAWHHLQWSCDLVLIAGRGARLRLQLGDLLRPRQLQRHTMVETVDVALRLLQSGYSRRKFELTSLLLATVLGKLPSSDCHSLILVEVGLRLDKVSRPIQICLVSR